MRALSVVPHAAARALPHLHTPNLGGRDLLSVHDLKPGEVEYILHLAQRAKAASVLKCSFVISKIFLNCFHVSQPIPLDSNVAASTEDLKRPGLVSPLMRF